MLFRRHAQSVVMVATVPMIVVMSIIFRSARRRLTVMARYPFGIPIQIMFLFPDRNTVLDLVDDVAAGPECRIAMRCRNADPDGDLSDLQAARPVHGHGLADLEALQRLRHDTFAFKLRQSFVGFIFQTIYGTAVIPVTDPAFKGAEATRFGQMQILTQQVQIQRRRRHPKAAHPPVTGGMNTMWSPSFRGCVQGAKSPLIATRSFEASKGKAYVSRNSS